jgi:thioredoxin 1
MLADDINFKLLLPILFLALIVLFLVFRIYKMRHIISAENGPDSSDFTKELTDNTFNERISKGVSLVDFWAPWCAPCRIQGPIVNDLANEVQNRAHICKMNVDENQKTARRFSIRSIPTILIFKDGNMVKQFVGVKAKTELLKELEKHLAG